MSDTNTKQALSQLGDSLKSLTVMHPNILVRGASWGASVGLFGAFIEIVCQFLTQFGYVGYWLFAIFLLAMIGAVVALILCVVGAFIDS